MRLELGCGANHDAGWFGIDQQPLPGVNLVWDLNQTPIPLEDGSAEAIYSSHVLEHIRELIPLMNDCHRLLIPGGEFRAIFPQVMDAHGIWHAEAFQDPTHIRFFVPDSWKYFVAGEFLHGVGCTYGILPWDLVSFSDQGWQAEIVLRRPLSWMTH